MRENLGKGEAEAILLAIEINSENDYIILDDKVARKKALSFGLNVKGTIGILRMLYQKNLLDTPPHHIFEILRKHKFRVKQGIYESILKEFY